MNIYTRMFKKRAADNVRNLMVLAVMHRRNGARQSIMSITFKVHGGRVRSLMVLAVMHQRNGARQSIMSITLKIS